MSFRLGVDVGGTFTDFALMNDTGEILVHKSSSTPANPALGVLNGICELAQRLDMNRERLLREVKVIVHGTTVTTNAVLTGSGARTGLLVTEGFRDILEMRQGLREEMFNNRLPPPPPLVPRTRRAPVVERIDYSGRELRPLNLESLRRAVQELKAEQVEAIAISFLHSYANPEHELQAAAVVQEALPDTYLTVSAKLLPQIRYYDRTSTATLNSYVGPVLRRYLTSLTRQLVESGFQGVLLIMQSNGGVTTPQVAVERAATTLLSGPAAAPVAGIAVASAQGFDDCITVDMGGTSFDAALVQNRVPLVTVEGWVARHRLALPMLDIHTIGAGGGSIGWIDEGGLLRMGPRSAGAEPGPACYGRGGALPTCTDADLVLGFINPDYFLGGRMPLDVSAACGAIAEHVARPLRLTLEEAAAGMHHVINVNMAAAIREISVKRGIDPRGVPMVVAGGAGPVHAGFIAQELDIPIVLVPRESSVFCAGGMVRSDLKHDYVRTYHTRLSEVVPANLARLWDEMRADAVERLRSEEVGPENIRLRFSADMRYLGQHHEINVPVDQEAFRSRGVQELAHGLHAAHTRLYGYSLEETGRDIELLLLRLEAVGITPKPALVRQSRPTVDAGHCVKGTRPVWLPECRRFEKVPVYDGELMGYDHRVSGPAIIERVHTTIVVPLNFNMIVDAYGTYCLYRKDVEESYLGRVLG